MNGRAVREDEVFEAVRALVERGEYLDRIPGLPGVALTGGGVIMGSEAGVQRLYGRGSREYLDARAAGLVEPLPALSVAQPSAIVAAEAALGYALPPLLRRLYTTVGNGGFGPGYGLLGLDGGHTDDGQTALSLWQKSEILPRALLPICHWGCAIYSLVDCSTIDGAMWGLDPNPVPDEEEDKALFPQTVTFAEWLARWVECRLYPPFLSQDPTTGEWRAATEEEIRGDETS
jgi:hypothetical protein